jgi:hypothetical protein
MFSTVHINYSIITLTKIIWSTGAVDVRTVINTYPVELILITVKLLSLTEKISTQPL